MWAAEKKGFKAWLQLEKSLSDHSVEAYLRDIEKLSQFLSLQDKPRIYRKYSTKRPAVILKMDWRPGYDRQFTIPDYFRDTLFF